MMNTYTFNSKILLTTAILMLNCTLTETINAAEFKGVVGGGLDIGGDTLFTVTLADGSTTVIKANEGLALNAGIVMIIDQYETQASAGYKLGGTSRNNGSVTWETVPVELVQFIRAGNIRIGLGFIYHINPKLVINMQGTNETYNFSNTWGTLAQVGWVPMDMPLSIDLRYTAIKYKSGNLTNSEDIHGNVLGIYASYFF